MSRHVEAAGTLPSGDDSSTKQQAAETAQAGKDAAAAVAGTAADQAKNVAHETGEQARDLLGKTKTQLREQTAIQQDAIVENLRSLGDQLAEMTDHVEHQGTAVDIASQARDRVRTAADWLDGRDPAEVLDEVRALGRNKPGQFLLGAALAGIVAGRLTRGVVAVHTDDTDTSSAGSGANSPAPSEATRRGDDLETRRRPATETPPASDRDSSGGLYTPRGQYTPGGHGQPGLGGTAQR